MSERGAFNEDQVQRLLLPVRAKRVRIKQGKSHMEGYDIRAHLTRLFGFGNWDIEGPPAELLFEDKLDTGKQKDNKWPALRWEVGYRQSLTLVVRDPQGREVCRYRGEATGKSENQPSRADAHDGAMKEAETQALKRAATNLGDQFGLGLYNKNAKIEGATWTATVGMTLVGMPTSTEPSTDLEASTPEVGADVEHGEPEQQEQPATNQEIGPEHPDHPMHGQPAEQPAEDRVTPEQWTTLMTELAKITGDQKAMLKKWWGVQGFKVTAQRLTTKGYEAIMHEATNMQKGSAGRQTPSQPELSPESRKLREELIQRIDTLGKKAPAAVTAITKEFEAATKDIGPISELILECAAPGKKWDEYLESVVLGFEQANEPTPEGDDLDTEF